MSSTRGEPVASREPLPLPRRLVSTLRIHYGAVALGVLFLVLSLYYNLSIPRWESDNEWSHFLYVRHIATEGTLPGIDATTELPSFTDQCRSGEEILLAEANHQFRQPPLYYLLGSLVTSWTSIDDLPALSANPFRLWDPAQLGYNFLLHAAHEPVFDPGAVLSLRALRLLSGLFGLLGLAAAYLTGLLIFSGRRPLALAVMAVNAFIPQYLFASATVNNDILVAALGAWCVYLCLVAVARWPNYGAVILATVTAALAVVAKYNGLALVPLVGLVALITLYRTWKQGDQTIVALLARVAVLLAVALLPALLWFGRNVLLYGRPLVGYPAITDNLLLGTWFRPEEFVQTTGFIFSSFWGLFGWETITLPTWVVGLLAVVALWAVAGVVLYLLDKKRSGEDRLLALLALLFVAVVWFTGYSKGTDATEPRGRYLLPAYSTISALMVLGLQRALPISIKRAGLSILVGALFLLALAVPPFVLRPAYAAPHLDTAATLQPDEQPVEATFGGFAELLGYRIEPQHLTAGDPIEVSLVWRALATTPNNYVVSIHLVDSDLQSRALVNTHPGNGNYPTSRWQPGDIFRESYILHWAESPWDDLPQAASIKVAMHCARSEIVSETYLEAVDPLGNPVGDAVYLGQLKVVPRDWHTAAVPASELRFTFGDEIGLVDIAFDPPKRLRGQDLTLIMDLQALKQPVTDYTVFAHIVDQEGNQVGGNDAPLTNGHYPSNLWDPDEQVVHRHAVRIPLALAPGAYRLRLGLYDPVTGARLPLQDDTGTAVPYVELPLLSVGSYHDLFVPQVLAGAE